jgi:hypothetical protein
MPLRETRTCLCPLLLAHPVEFLGCLSPISLAGIRRQEDRVLSAISRVVAFLLFGRPQPFFFDDSESSKLRSASMSSAIFSNFLIIVLSRGCYELSCSVAVACGHAEE